MTILLIYLLSGLLIASLALLFASPEVKVNSSAALYGGLFLIIIAWPVIVFFVIKESYKER